MSAKYHKQSFHLSQSRKARKEHKCYSCKLPIAKGEKYSIEKGVFDNAFYCDKHCADCAQMLNQITTLFPDVADDGMLETAYTMYKEYVMDEDFEALKQEVGEDTYNAYLRVAKKCDEAWYCRECQEFLASIEVEYDETCTHCGEPVE